MGTGSRLAEGPLAGSDSASVEVVVFEVDVVPAETFELVGEVFADLVDTLVVIEPSERPPIDVPLRTDWNDSDELSVVVDADRVEGGTGADSLGGRETEGI
jgi:hypothetical protein